MGFAGQGFKDMSKKTPKGNRQVGHRGAALVITLLVIATLTGLTVAFSEESNIELSLAGFSRDGYKAHQMARSGVHLALATLIKIEKEKAWDKLEEGWDEIDAKSFPDAFPAGSSISGTIVDESGKFNINSLINQDGEIDSIRELQLTRLFHILALEESMVKPVLDWLDIDNEERMEGAENYYYQGLEDPYECGNGPFLTVRQVFLVKGINEIKSFGEESERDLLDFLTIYSDGKININTAPNEILQCLSERIDASIAEAILEYRQEERFTSIEGLKDISGIDQALFDEIKNLITVTSSAYTIETEGKSQDASSGIKAVAMREGEAFRLVYWQVN